MFCIVLVVFFDGLNVFLFDESLIRLLFMFGVVEGKCFVGIFVVCKFLMKELMFEVNVIVFVFKLIDLSYCLCELFLGWRFWLLCWCIFFFVLEVNLI